jgi:hypothetical protein
VFEEHILSPVPNAVETKVHLSLSITNLCSLQHLIFEIKCIANLQAKVHVSVSDLQSDDWTDLQDVSKLPQIEAWLI